MTLIDTAIQRPVTVSVGVIIVVLFGLLSLFRIPIQLIPDVDRPTITVQTDWPGASPQEIEREIVDPQEKQLRSLEGLTDMTSTSYYSRGVITLEFAIGTNMDTAMLQVNNKLQQVPSYPPDADKPIISSASDQSPPIAYLTITKVGSGGRSILLWRKFVEDNVQPHLERIPGVAKVDLFSGREVEMQVVFDPGKMAARRLTLGQLIAGLQAENRNVSGGVFDQGKRSYTVRTTAEFLKPEDIPGVVVARLGGNPIHVRDVAATRIGYKRLDTVVRASGRTAMVMRVIRQTGSNVLTVMAQLKKAIAEVNKTILGPRGLKLTQVYDETEYIDKAINLVRTNLYIGGALAIIILLLFLRRVAPTVIVALAIPISVVGTFILMNLFGRNINVISLAGLSFATGMVVDNAIVSLENIYRLHQGGMPPFEAARKGVAEVWGALVASTLTTLAVFLPVIFIQQEAGQLFRDIAIAISCSIFLSLIVAVTVIPTMAARMMGRGNGSGPKWRHPLYNLFGLVWVADKIAGGVAGLVYWLCGRVTTRLAVVVVMTGASVAMTFGLIPKAEYLPTGNRNLVFAIMLPPPGYGNDEILRTAKYVEDQVRPRWEAFKKTGRAATAAGPNIHHFFFVGRLGQFFMGAASADFDRTRELIPFVRGILSGVPGMISIVQQSSLFRRGSSQGRVIEVQITGPDLTRLIELAQRTYFRLKQIMPEAQMRPNPGLDLGNPELRVVPDRDRASRLGLKAADIGTFVRSLIEGVKVAEVYWQGVRVDLTLKAPDDFITRLGQIEQTLINTPAGKRVPLSAVAKVRLVAGPTQVLRVERQRAITIQVLPPERLPLEQAMDEIRQKVIAPLRKQMGANSLYNIRLSGTADDLTRTRNALLGNFILALIITYLLMAALFENFAFPLVIMFSVPLAAAGGFLGLFLVNQFVAYQAMDVLTMLGFVILIGVVVNNAILIVHQALNFMRGQGLHHREAIRMSVRTRIRPIMMTALTSCFGMMPLVLFPGAGSELYRGLGSVVVGGLLVSTVFTLF
ncbi:MAG: efflux RND transporter permease subunit, partial [Proteobacteria bacterium]|nr:efflux RND transporter permease subunit [Pseudomonadota bacterium]